VPPIGFVLLMVGKLWLILDASESWSGHQIKTTNPNSKTNS